MIAEVKKIIQRVRGKIRYRFFPQACFRAHHYQRHNQRRQEHLATLGLDLRGSTVLEVGAGIGDHTSFFLDRGCKVVTTEARAGNLKVLRRRYPNLDIRHLDLDCPSDMATGEVFDIVYCYGLLYHLKNPGRAIEFMGDNCRKMLLLETVVSYGEEKQMHVCEPAEQPTQSITGIGCRPTREWVYNQLKRHFTFVYMPTTQPNHEEFPIDWSSPPRADGLTRAVFIASRDKIYNDLLIESIPMNQTYC